MRVLFVDLFIFLGLTGLALDVYARLHALERRIAKLESGPAASLNPSMGIPEPKTPTDRTVRGSSSREKE